MTKYKTCEQCDAEFKIIQPDGNEDIFGKPQYCPFCATDLHFKKDDDGYSEEDYDE